MFSSMQATQATQKEIFKNTTRVEGSILQAMASTSHSLQDDIKSLAEKLDDLRLDSVQQTVAQFTESHRDLLEHLSSRLDSIFAMHTDFRAHSDESQLAATRQNILDSLHFSQISDRKDHIPKSYNETYLWILEPKRLETPRYDDFIAWLGTPSSNSRIYWVHGKIGAGKTTLLRFLEDNLAFQHMLPWANGASVVRASYFFWNAGNKMQKSTGGLLRTLLTQLFEDTPDLISQVVQPKKWQKASLTGDHTIDWTDSELRDCLREYISYAGKSRKVFLLIDGLDEFDGTDEAREDLIDLLMASVAHENVKICLSSRPWNIFRNAFGSCPQLKLEDLTHDDISAYVRQQLYENRRFQKLMQYDVAAANGLVASLIRKAAGVFLWVRLVVKQLLKGLRDGDSIQALSIMIHDVPADLDDYFLRLMESIEPQHRKEAAELLQLALYYENEFVSLHTNSLLDFSFVEEGKPDFALDPSYDFSNLDFLNLDAMAFRLESTMRKLTSRCMGLLECHHDREMEKLARFQEDDDEGSIEMDSSYPYMRSDEIHVPISNTKLPDEKEVLTIANLTVEVLHRSLRDFLLTPKAQTLLHQYTHGPYDTRMFFRNARLVQLVALNKVEEGFFNSKIGLASYILSTLAVPIYRETSSAAAVATIMRPVIENSVQFDSARSISGWYVSCVLGTWHEENSTFSTLAIDFGLHSYVLAHLTPQSVQSKRGRPILDYILRPRFATEGLHICVGYTSPDLTLLSTVLGFGADPNCIYRSVSVWGLFLCFIADHFRRLTSVVAFDGEAYMEALKIMIQNGADILLPEKWLLDAAALDGFLLFFEDEWLDETPDESLRRRFPHAVPVIQRSLQSDAFYHVIDLLEHFCNHFGLSLDPLKAVIQQQHQYGASVMEGLR